ncbi:replication stress response regulator SDE2 isoform X2 [Arvicola amphibius]|uniref:replication stress response regulator SDE2 isoform X2 n=1 Tax=Arvicola amphibius TaxID=1047088 RepID=UPI0018E2CEB4|nr:replication stress response regulator SDE2 isoform X2 [Arvicola amphibius]
MAEAAVLAWVRGPGTGCKALPWASARCSVRDVVYRHCQEQGIPVDCFFVKCNGVLVAPSDTVQHGAVYSLEPRLCGGKGGFGSMLRALGAQIEKTTNREACRDLSGRRLRDVNHEKAMAEWVKQQAEREAEKEQRRLERLQRKLAEPKHCFSSPDYQRQCHEMAERLEDSVLKGMQAASSKMVSADISETRKRPNKSKAGQGAGAKKKKCFWLGMEGLEASEGSSAGSSDDDSDEVSGTSGLNCSAPEHGSDSFEVVASCPCSPQRSGLSTHSEAPEELQKTMTDPGQDIVENTQTEWGETSSGEHNERKMVTETEDVPAKKETESPKPTQKDQETGVTGRDRIAVELSGEDRKSVPVANLEGSHSGDTALGREAVDLFAFSSAAELESLGLERLKCELMALGLKCGGTLQERAARLFSVRGLAKEHIDPALFAKPSKGKKK